MVESEHAIVAGATVGSLRQALNSTGWALSIVIKARLFIDQRLVISLKNIIIVDSSGILGPVILLMFIHGTFLKRG